MNLFLQTHIVKKGETLGQIAEMYNVPNIGILKYYHYQNVPKDANHLGNTLLPGQEIFIPDQKEIERILQIKNKIIEEKKFQANSLIENNILFPSFSKINHYYHVTIRDLSDNVLNNETVLEIHLKYIGKKDKHYIFSYHKKVLSVNGQLPDFKIYELATECTKYLFPAELEIDEKGIIKNLNNYREILNNWKNIRQKLIHKYQDSYSLDYIDDVNDSMEVREELIENFSRDIILQFLFVPYFKKFHQGDAELNERFTEHRLLFQSQYAVSINDDEIYINQHSECIDPRSQQEIINYLKTNYNQPDENEFLESEINADYTVLKSDKILQRADITTESFLYNIRERREIKIDMK